MKYLLPWLAFVFAGVPVLSGPTVSEADPALNEWCPVIPEEKADPKITLDYGGQTVAFCCDRCMAKFQANPGKYVSRLPQFSSGTGAEIAHGAGNHEHGEPSGRERDPAGRDDPHPDSSPAPEQGEQGGHNHEHADADGAERTPILGRLHPVIVHFPLAGIPIALLAFLAWVVTGREELASADLVPLFVGTFASVAAVITGNIAHDAMRFAPSMHVIVERHQFASTSVMILALVLSCARLWCWSGMTDQWRWMYGGGLVLVSMLLGLTGFLGGSLVFGPDHLKW